MSFRNAGAAKLTVNAVTPSRMNSRRESLVISVSDELILGRSNDELREPGALCVELRVGPGPNPSGVQVREQIGPRLPLEGGWRQPVEKEIPHIFGSAAIRRRSSAEIESLIGGQRGREIHAGQHGA